MLGMCHAYLAHPESIPLFPSTALAYTRCSPCHGDQAEGKKELGAPSLIGQPLTYLEDQMQAFQKGWRTAHNEHTSNEIMANAIVEVQEKDVQLALQHIQSISTDQHPSRILGHQKRGKFLYDKHCSVCHGPKAEGSYKNRIPRLNLQHAWYLKSQLERYKKDQRGTHHEDEMGMTMSFYAKLIPDDKAMNDIVAYLSNISRKKTQNTSK